MRKQGITSKELKWIPKTATVTRYIYFFDPKLSDVKEFPKNWKEQNKIMMALAKGKLVYETGKTFGLAKHKLSESLNPATRKRFGLKPLDQIITNLANLEFIKYHNSKFSENGDLLI